MQKGPSCVVFIGAKGPSCVLDAGKKLLTISGRLELFKFSVDGYVEATPTRFTANIVSRLLGFYFKVFIAAGLTENGIPGGVTAGFEAGAPGHEDIRTTLSNMIKDSLNKAKDAGMRVITAAKKKIEDAQAVFNNAARKVADQRRAVNAARAKVNAYLYICLDARLHSCRYICLNSCPRTCLCTCICTCLCPCLYTRLYTCL